MPNKNVRLLSVFHFYLAALMRVNQTLSWGGICFGYIIKSEQSVILSKLDEVPAQHSLPLELVITISYKMGGYGHQIWVTWNEVENIFCLSMFRIDKGI